VAVTPVAVTPVVTPVASSPVMVSPMPPTTMARSPMGTPAAAKHMRTPSVQSAPVAKPRAAPIAPRLPNLESTQTVRALTPSEIESADVQRWYVIQLGISDTAFDPESLPNCDIFNEYRLYSVASVDQGRTIHALRVGFFSEEVAAAAVASYLAAFYDKPSVKRVSTAERERFGQHRLEARKDIGATGKHAVIEITNERVVRERREAGISVSDLSPAGQRPAPSAPAK
jgi:hypothetical protein